ncbi:MAG TPA: molybdopterin molybdotransferase MoeA [Bacteroidales bacterium]|nr:molybdopterin molybdotransferase MoeA [Bacteroidales bacterium]
MVSFEDAYDQVIQAACATVSERIHLAGALHRILAGPVVSDTDMPPFDKSAVDGFACRREDLGKELECVETIPAGVVPGMSIKSGQCARIMTGSVVPEGADMVMMVEDTVITEKGRIRYVKERSATNICYRAEDIHTGDVILLPGILIRPQEIAVLASAGCIHPEVYRQPSVGVISTGDELVEPDMTPQWSQIRNSNSSQLIAQLAAMDIRGSYFGIARDHVESLVDRLRVAMDSCDVVLLTGGVSMGDYDHVPEAFERLKVKIMFHSIAIQPGRPTVFGMAERKYIFGLPGNPVSSFVIFEILVKPMLYKLMGHDHKPVRYRLPMGTTHSRKRSDRKSLIPVNIMDGKVVPVTYHGSAHIHSYVSADGIIAMEAGTTRINEGEMVDVRRI